MTDIKSLILFILPVQHYELKETFRASYNVPFYLFVFYHYQKNRTSKIILVYIAVHLLQVSVEMCLLYVNLF